MATMTQHWIKRLAESKKPAYLLIADLIEEDIASQRLRARDRLPALRDLAAELNLNYTTVARAIREAKKRGLIDSKVGTGTFVRGRAPAMPLRDGSGVQMTMNPPPEPPELETALKDSMAEILNSANVYELLRYRDFGGSLAHREIAAAWLSPFIPNCSAERVLISPGIHSVLLALLTQLARPGDVVCAESLVYPGLKAIAAQLGIRLHAIPSDADGPVISAFENACKTQQPKAFYCNPTIQNPSTATMSLQRRKVLVDTALRYNVPIIEDDAYGMLPANPPPTLAALAPELCWYISGFSKCFGPGLRIGFAVAPSVRQSQRLAGSLRATTVMASPITELLAINWIKNGMTEKMLKAIRAESAVRQGIAKEVLRDWPYQTQEGGFHVWLPVPSATGWQASELAVHLRNQGVGVVASAAFSIDNNPPEALRICLGWSKSHQHCRQTLTLLAETLETPNYLGRGF